MTNRHASVLSRKFLFDSHNRLTWDRTPEGRDDASVVGYRLYYGPSSGLYNGSLDAGNNTQPIVGTLLEPNITHFVAVKSYNVYGTESAAFSNEVEYLVFAPVITSITPDHGLWYEWTPITITGDHFAPEHVAVAFRKASGRIRFAHQLEVVDQHTIVALTSRCESDCGAVDVIVTNPDLHQGILPGGYFYEGTEVVGAELTCLPASGTVPFVVNISALLENHYAGQPRRIAGQIDLDLAGGQHFSGWRNGYSNIAPASNLVFGFSQIIPELQSVIGENVFNLYAMDVTPAPYNQQPYPPSGGSDMDDCTVVGIAP